jgi:photosystem II stability/assembly factor-like uncharacterized protein
MKSALALLVVGFLLPGVGVAETWRSIGPPGGDVRALAADPSHPGVLYLGTADGVLYKSSDGGSHWDHPRPGFPLRGMSLDEIVVDGRGRVQVAYWEVSGGGGGFARSEDGGATFTLEEGIKGQSVRALAAFPRNPDVLAAGTLEGVFRSEDGGRSWQKLQAPPDVRNVESVAFDPENPEILYAGTWHLPWKTADGGKTWRPMHAGIIDDSDIFTLTVDRRSRSILYATACTGIYRSGDAGALWGRIQGIPSSSRRTRSFAQDPEHPEILYAGTTEGLWVSTDSAQSWHLATSKALVVNSVLVLPGSQIYLGCDGAGVLRSLDGGSTFAAVNDGFSERFVSAVLFDPATGRSLVGTWGDRQHGGVFARAGSVWRRLGVGLEGRDVLALSLFREAVWAGTDDGVYRFREGSGAWTREPLLVSGREVHARVVALASVPGALVAATEDGLYSKADPEGGWEVRTPASERGLLGVASSDKGLLLSATPLGIYRSANLGASWERVSSAPDPRIRALGFLPGSDTFVFAPSPTGLYRSHDAGKTWSRGGGGLPVSDIAGLAFHPDGKTLYASDFTWGGLFRSDDRGDTWVALPTDGLASDRIWTIAIDPKAPGAPLVAGRTGGLSEPGSPPLAATK